jgi:hypothetical protein
MAKVPDSNRSESWTVRIPNDLAALARDKAISLGMLKLGGKPNTTLIIHAALRSWLELPNDISNTVSNNVSNDLSYDVIQVLQSRLDELSNVISNTVKRDELALFKDEINSVLEPLRFGLETVKLELQSVESAIAIPEIRHSQLDLTEIFSENPSPVLVTSEHLYPLGAKLDFEGLGKHLGFHPTNYSTDAKKLGQSSDEYINNRAIAKGELWERGKEGKKAVFTRVK